jgi:hypothetical protein
MRGARPFKPGAREQISTRETGYGSSVVLR